MNYKLDDVVYSKDVYDFNEPLKVIGIRKNSLELEGDFSGGTHLVIQSEWIPIENVSKIYDYRSKLIDRIFAKASLNSFKDNYTITRLAEIVLHLTQNLENEKIL